jgi:pilus assembly protein CpaF
MTGVIPAQLARVVHEQLLEALDLRRNDVVGMSDAALRGLARQLISEIVSRRALPIDLDRRGFEKLVLEEAVGLGPLEDLLADDSVSEVMINGPDDVFVETAGRLRRVSTRFSGVKSLYGVIERMLAPTGRRIDEGSPMVDARLRDGSRVNIVIPPLTLKGPTVTIRKFAKSRMQLPDLLQRGTLSAAMAEFLELAVRTRRNIVVSGGTGSGKTTLLNVLSRLIPAGERVVTIEDAAELQLEHDNLVALEARPRNLEGKGLVSIRELVRNALRMRPDRIVVGECRGGEALDMLQAMNTGHDGSLTTAHANSPRDVLSRIEVMVLMSGLELPVAAIREQMASAIDIIVQQARFPCGARKISRITEVTGVESGTVQTQDLFRYVRTGIDALGNVRGYFSGCAQIPVFYEELIESGNVVNVALFDRTEPPRPGLSRAC